MGKQRAGKGPAEQPFPPERVRQDLRAIGETDAQLAGAYYESFGHQIEGICRRAVRSLRGGYDRSGEGVPNGEPAYSWEDVRNDLFVRFKEKAGGIEAEFGIASVLTWLNTAALHLSVDDIREGGVLRDRQVLAAEGYATREAAERDVQEARRAAIRRHDLTRVRNSAQEVPAEDRLLREERIERMGYIIEEVIGTRNSVHQEVIRRRLRGERPTAIAHALGLKRDNVDQIWHRFTIDARSRLDRDSK